MHDIDKTMLELGEGEFESENLADGEFEFEWESGEIGSGMDAAVPFSESEEMELASELLNVSSEEELDQFLGNLFKKAWHGIKKVGSFVGKVARPLSGVLKGIAKKALPFVGGALGSFIPIPGVGTAVGTALGGALSKALEMEGLNVEDHEFEMARRFVRVAGTAARNAAVCHPHMDPRVAAKTAVITALKQHVPQIAAVSGISMPGFRNPGRIGRWYRHGTKIVLLDV
jgi:hypothetical protein